MQRPAIRTRIEHLLAVDQESKPKVYLRIFDAAEVFSLNYALELLLSAGIATLGLVLDSPAVVIGAMLISPSWDPFSREAWPLPRPTFAWGSRPF